MHPTAWRLHWASCAADVAQRHASGGAFAHGAIAADGPALQAARPAFDGAIASNAPGLQAGRNANRVQLAGYSADNEIGDALAAQVACNLGELRFGHCLQTQVVRSPETRRMRTVGAAPAGKLCRVIKRAPSSINTDLDALAFVQVLPFKQPARGAALDAAHQVVEGDAAQLRREAGAEAQADIDQADRDGHIGLRPVGLHIDHLDAHETRLGALDAARFGAERIEELGGVGGRNLSGFNHM
jgi:hypothetical protein